jgi:hypothetical protein
MTHDNRITRTKHQAQEHTAALFTQFLARGHGRETFYVSAYNTEPVAVQIEFGKGTLFGAREYYARSSTMAGVQYVLRARLMDAPDPEWTTIFQQGFTAFNWLFRINRNALDIEQQQTPLGLIVGGLVVNALNRVPATPTSLRQHHDLSYCAPRPSHPSPHLFSGDIVVAIIDGVVQRAIFSATPARFRSEAAPVHPVPASALEEWRFESMGHSIPEVVKSWADAMRDAVSYETFNTVHRIVNISGKTLDLYPTQVAGILRRACANECLPHATTLTSAQLIELTRSARYRESDDAITSEFLRLLELSARRRLTWTTIGERGCRFDYLV